MKRRVARHAKQTTTMKFEGHSELSLTTVVIEDDEKVRTALASMINRSADIHCVREFGCAEDALEYFQEHSVNVAVVDINLPGLSGIECVRRLKHPMPTIQFLMVTVYEDADHIFEALEAGATGYTDRHQVFGKSQGLKLSDLMGWNI
ncbi:MAG TPA: response regulator transcription factor, partial [Verrucomicrobiales bacterium]|nr:response regulator transcription factor [Verrucomicrobiales bacterium]